MSVSPSATRPTHRHVEDKMARKVDPMSLSSMLSDDVPSRLSPKPSPAPEIVPSAYKMAPTGFIPRQETNVPRRDSVDAESSDGDDAAFAGPRQVYRELCHKRQLDIEALEEQRRKRRRTAIAQTLALHIGTYVDEGKERFRILNEAAAYKIAQRQEQQNEKERKKDMQRQRRREKTLHTQSRLQKEAVARARQAEDDSERQKHIREAQKAEKKVRSTKKILDGSLEDPDNLLDVVPLAPNLSGGTMSAFPTLEDSPEPPKKKLLSRPKKSKEKKCAEKAAAEAGHRAVLAAEESASEDDLAVSTLSSKAYVQLYELIWRDIARKEIPKVYRIKETSLTTRQSNLKKTAQLASKEARRWQLRTNKGNKDLQARAKRSMREMMSFWKRNEKTERDLRKNAEKQELESAKKAEADRESNRQKRKLNFLIEQTELYSHFIGRKIKTDEIEGTPTTAVPEVSVGTGKVTNFEDIDFDAEDDATLRQAAAANAQNAVQEAQARARAFNGEGAQAQFDDGELNFQNPTGLGDITVAQPKMLTAQLKEYQLKGLNWLVNLYEQGINGILADEMGLGKTVQSISVMGYLAEKHDIWGPFLVIAPASTLHNWQQEITRFVPDLKCLPYWGNAKDRKILRKFWDRRHITYNKDSPFHALITSYQLVVQDAQYFQKVKWQYMILDEAQAIKSSQSSRWKSLLGFHCRNRLLLTGTPIQNNMQELWALLHFIMPSLFDSHDEFSEWFSKDIESHAQSNTKLNEDQLRRLLMILKPFMLRRVKKHVQKELGDKKEEDVYCDLTYRQRAIYGNLRNNISVMDLIEKAAVGDDQDTATLMNLVMQFRKVCNHPDLFERADTTSPFAMVHFAETASFLREGQYVNVDYSTRNLIEYDLPRILCSDIGRLDVPGPANPRAGFLQQKTFTVWDAKSISNSSWLPFTSLSVGDILRARKGVGEKAIEVNDKGKASNWSPFDRKEVLPSLLDISKNRFMDQGLGLLEQCARPAASAPPIQICSSSQTADIDKENVIFNISLRRALHGRSLQDELAIVEAKVLPTACVNRDLLPEPILQHARYTNIQVPSMSRFVTDSGKLARLDKLLRELKAGGHRVLLYFQMTRMIDLMEEYLTFRNYKYLRLDGSTKLEDRRDTVADFQTKPEIFVFLLSTRAGGLGINLTAADTVIFYDSDWNPTIDSQAMDRAHRLGQTKQVTVYRMITRGTIEERIRTRALEKEEVQRVVISGGSGAGVDFTNKAKESRTKDIAMWLADDQQAEMLERKEQELAGRKDDHKKASRKKAKKKDVSLEDMYHEGEGHFEAENKPSGTATPLEGADPSEAGSKGVNRVKKSKGAASGNYQE